MTIVYSGEVEHRDSTGGGGLIGPGDVQWMTAASGLVHEEMHGRDFTKSGGTLEMIQLWVNLPAKDKKRRPYYQSITAARSRTCHCRTMQAWCVIAGRFNGAVGPAHTFTPINLWDVRLNAGHAAELAVPAGHNALVFVLSGQIELASGETVNEAGLAILDPAGDSIAMKAIENAKLLVMDGEPINEPVVAYGPFVMNSQAEIHKPSRITRTAHGKLVSG